MPQPLARLRHFFEPLVRAGRSGGNDTTWVDAVYTMLLGRQADAAGEAHWSGQLAAGVSRLQVAQSIANSSENQTQLINGAYLQYLGRSADAGGLSYWLAQFAGSQTSEDLIAGFTGSAEYYEDQTERT